MTDVLRSMRAVLEDTDAALVAGASAAGRVWGTGFASLDTYLSGGFRAGELILFGGPQGLGKTTWALQVARAVAIGGRAVAFFSFEQAPSAMFERLVAAEAGEAQGMEGVPISKVRAAMENADATAGTLADRLATWPGSADALRQIRSYADRLFIHNSSVTVTDLEEIRTVAQRVHGATGELPLVIVDYLQKVPVPGGPEAESERVTVVVEGLKDLALELEVPILAIVAAEKAGLEPGKRLRVGHLRGSSALAYEADVVLVLNEKYDIVARQHLVYDTRNADRFRDWAVLTIEKNRSGLARIELEFRKRFEQSRFETDGQPVAEDLVDERVFVQ